MKRIAGSVLASLLLLSSCGSDASKTPEADHAAKPTPAPTPSSKPPAETPKPPAETPKPAAETPPPPATVDMDAEIKTLMAKDEQPIDKIEIQHILISFQGAPRMSGVTRTKEEAKALAQKVYAEAIGGGDFDALVKQYTNDSPPGIYSMTQASRRGMVKSFGDVGWRLKVGEIGVAPWDAGASPYGWHIIKRLK
jgi:PBP1b-binding outer membrane lipoprotein LpoB